MFRVDAAPLLGPLLPHKSLQARRHASRRADVRRTRRLRVLRPRVGSSHQGRRRACYCFRRRPARGASEGGEFIGHGDGRSEDSQPEERQEPRRRQRSLAAGERWRRGWLWRRVGSGVLLRLGLDGEFLFHVVGWAGLHVC
jgi:hypothetical protein